MKRVICMVGIFFLLYLVMNVTPNTQAGEPQLLIPEISFDFGYTPTKSVVSHYYLVKNVGADTLKIKEVKPG